MKPKVDQEFTDYLEGGENILECPQDWLSSCKTTK